MSGRVLDSTQARAHAHRPARSLCLVLLGAIAGSAPAFSANTRSAPDVFVIGALHELHKTEEAFSYDELRRTLAHIKADVWVLEVRPDELSSRSKTPGRPEYPAVIWPLLNTVKTTAIAMEPGGDEFKRISQAAGGGVEVAQREDPAGTGFLDRLETTLDGMLQAHWMKPADTQDGVTSDVTRALAMIQTQIYGAGYAKAQAEWDAFMAARAVESVRANPAKRIVVLGSYRNRALLTQALQRAAPERVVDVEKYLRSGELTALPVDRAATE